MTATATDPQTANLTRTEAAYLHLASFKHGDRVVVGGPAFCQIGKVTLTDCHDGRYPEPGDNSAGLEEAYLHVDGDGTTTTVTVDSLLSGDRTVTTLADAAAGNSRYFDTATWVMFHGTEG